jgi:threonine dehydratase
MASRQDITAAAERLRLHVRRTPLVAAGPGDETLFKLELLQHTGSFKPRGAFNFVLSHRVPAAGIVAASGGNHGQAVAYVANRLGITAEVFVPEVCSPLKRARIAGYGARVVVGGAIFDDAQAACEARASDTGALVVHPFDVEEVIAGQGTIGMELSEDDPDLDTVLVATGGGGLIAGIASWYSGGIRVVSVEPEESCCLAAAVKAGGPVDVSVGGAAADSLGARRLGGLAYEIVRDHVAVAVTVSEADIRQAQRELWDRLRVIAEPGGATAYAALIAGAYRPEPGERVAVVVCGANVDLAALPWV